MVEHNQTLSTGKQRLDYIDALRGIAALMVILCHSVQIDANLHLPNAIANIIGAGKYGVQLFFVISALTIFYSLSNSDNNTINFFIRRFFRIAPLYFVAILTYSLLYGNNDLLGIGLNILFLHGFSPQYINSVVPGGWSIGVEMAFYCMIPFLFQRVNNLEKAIYFFCVALLISFLSIYAYKKLGESTSAMESFIYFWLPNQLPVFSLGFIVFYLTFKADAIKVENLYYPTVLCCLIVLAGVVTKLSIIGDHLVFAIAVAVLVGLFKRKALPGMVNKFTLYLGKVSYSLYLLQYAALFILQKTGIYSLFPGNTGTASLLNVFLNILLLLLVTCTLSTGSYHLIEVPFQKMGRRFLIRKPVSINAKQPKHEVVILNKQNTDIRVK